MEKNKKTSIIIIILIIAIGLVGGGVYYSLNTKNDKKEEPYVDPGNNNDEPFQEVERTGDFNVDLIRVANKNQKGNYLISPYSIEIALSMLKEGTDGSTLSELEKVVPSRNITMLNVKNRISVANALFIKEQYKGNIIKSFSNALLTKYSSEIISDKFETAKVINDWADKNTYGMIKNLVDDNAAKNMILGLANAVAIDVEWKTQFECISTTEADFTTNGTVKKVEMMHNTYNSYTSAKYIKNDNEIGISIPYKNYKADGTANYESGSDTTDLEFIAVLPTTDLKTYVNNLTSEKLSSLINSFSTIGENQEVELSLPRFEYDFNWSSLKNALVSIGLQETMSTSPNFSKMLSGVSNLYIEKALHKTHISLNEKGTKAAAVTFFGVYETALPQENKIIDINFNKPFMYMIRDKKSGELLFFGVVETPNLWKGSTCSEK